MCAEAAGSAEADLGWRLVPFGATFGPSLSSTEPACSMSTDAFWLSCCWCCLSLRSGSINAGRSRSRTPAASFHTSSTDEERRRYVALATLLNHPL